MGVLHILPSSILYISSYFFSWKTSELLLIFWVFHISAERRPSLAPSEAPKEYVRPSFARFVCQTFWGPWKYSENLAVRQMQLLSLHMSVVDVLHFRWRHPWYLCHGHQVQWEEYPNRASRHRSHFYICTLFFPLIPSLSGHLSGKQAHHATYGFITEFLVPPASLTSSVVDFSRISRHLYRLLYQFSHYVCKVNTTCMLRPAPPYSELTLNV